MIPRRQESQRVLENSVIGTHILPRCGMRCAPYHKGGHTVMRRTGFTLIELLVVIAIM